MAKSGNRKKILNPKSGRMVYVDGVVGKKLLAKAHKKVKRSILNTSYYQISSSDISNWMDDKVPKSYWEKKWISWTTKEKRKIKPLVKYLLQKAYKENALFKAPNPPGSIPANKYEFGIDFKFTDTELLAVKGGDPAITKKFIKYFGFKSP